ncbi:MAG: hypothetical protein R8P61_32900 [Bacteroidia bacterium]|nr:hypothetical protein [Bacteroidia bacterium]
MPDKPKVIIYLSQQRSSYQTDYYRSLKIFDSEQSEENVRPNFGRLSRFDNNTLNAASFWSEVCSEDSHMFILPLVGTIRIEPQQQELEVGQCLYYPVKLGLNLVINNPYEKDAVNYLQFHISEKLQSLNFGPKLLPFNIDEHINDLVPLYKSPPIYICLGKFEGRMKGVYVIQQADKALFAYLIQGVMELEDRLLHEGDALSLHGFGKVEFEALSTEAIVLLLEISMEG